MDYWKVGGGSSVAVKADSTYVEVARAFYRDTQLEACGIGVGSGAARCVLVVEADVKEFGCLGGGEEGVVVVGGCEVEFWKEGGQVVGEGV